MDDVDVDWGLDDDGYNDDCLSLGGYDDFEEPASAPAAEPVKSAVKEEPKEVEPKKREEVNDSKEETKEKKEKKEKPSQPAAGKAVEAVAPSQPPATGTVDAPTHPSPQEKPLVPAIPFSQPQARGPSPQAERAEPRAKESKEGRERGGRSDDGRDKRDGRSDDRRDKRGGDSQASRDRRGDESRPERRSGRDERRSERKDERRDERRSKDGDRVEERRERERRLELESRESRGDGYHLKGAFQQPLHNSTDGLPPGWRRIVPDKAFREGIRIPPADRHVGTGRYFYRHEESGAGQWERPTGLPNSAGDEDKSKGRDEDRKEDDKPKPSQPTQEDSRAPPTGPAATRTVPGSTSSGSKSNSHEGGAHAPAAAPTGPRATRVAAEGDRGSRRAPSPVPAAANDVKRDVVKEPRDELQSDVHSNDGHNLSSSSRDADKPAENGALNRRDSRDTPAPAQTAGPRMNEARAAILNGGGSAAPPRAPPPRMGGRFGPPGPAGGPRGGRGPVPGRFGPMHGPSMPLPGPHGRGMRSWGSERAQPGDGRDPRDAPREREARDTRPPQAHNQTQTQTRDPLIDQPPRRSEEAEALRAQVKESRRGDHSGWAERARAPTLKEGEESKDSGGKRDRERDAPATKEQDRQSEKRKRDDDDGREPRSAARRDDNQSRQPDRQLERNDRGRDLPPAELYPQPSVHPSRRGFVESRSPRTSAPPPSRSPQRTAAPGRRSGSPERRATPAPARDPPKVPDLASRLSARPEPRGEPRERRNDRDRNHRNERSDRDARNDRGDRAEPARQEREQPKEIHESRQDLASRLCERRNRGERSNTEGKPERGQDGPGRPERRDDRPNRWPRERQASPVTRQSPERAERPPVRSPERQPPVHPARQELLAGSQSRSRAPASPVRQPRGPPPDAQGFREQPAYGPNAFRDDRERDSDQRDSQRSDRRDDPRESRAGRDLDHNAQPNREESAPAYGPNAHRPPQRFGGPALSATAPGGPNAPGRWPSARPEINGRTRSPPPHLDRRADRADRYAPRRGEGPERPERDHPERGDERDRERGWGPRGTKRPMEGAASSGREKRARSPGPGPSRRW